MYHPLGAVTPEIPASKPFDKRILFALVGLAALPFILGRKEKASKALAWRPKSRLPFYRDLSDTLGHGFELPEHEEFEMENPRGVRESHYTDEQLIAAVNEHGGIKQAAKALSASGKGAITHRSIQTRLRLNYFKKHPQFNTAMLDGICSIENRGTIKGIHGELVYDEKPFRIWVNRNNGVVQIQMSIGKSWYNIQSLSNTKYAIQGYFEDYGPAPVESRKRKDAANFWAKGFADKIMSKHAALVPETKQIEMFDEGEEE
jgi:hypothetical protein